MTWEDVDKMFDNLPEDISLLGAFLMVIERRCTKTQIIDGGIEKQNDMGRYI